MTAGGPRRTLLRPGILVAAVLAGTAGGYTWWTRLHQADTFSSALPFAGFLLLLGAAALSAEVASPGVRVFVGAALVVIFSVVGYAALMSLGIALIALAVVEVALLLEPLQLLSTRKAIASLGLGCLVGATIDVGFFNWTVHAH